MGWEARFHYLHGGLLKNLVFVVAFLFYAIKWIIETALMLVSLIVGLIISVPLWIIGTVAQACQTKPPEPPKKNDQQP